MMVRYLTRGSCDRPAVAVTFDDGPNPPRTEQVLAILAEYGARATFFVIGKWAERWPDTLRRVIAAGHLVGNHSFSHTVGTGDYDDAEAVIGHITGAPCRYARAPAFDYESCAQSALISSGELVLVDADVNPSDWDKRDTDEIAAAVLEHPSLDIGSIIDLHDGAEYTDTATRLGRPQAMVRALPAILAGLQKRGFEFVGLDELTSEEAIDWDPRGVDDVHRRALAVARSRRRG